MLISTSTCTDNTVEVGAYFYTWYQEGWFNAHWNDTISNNVVDVPLLGYYSSNNTETIKQQLQWIDEAQIDFCIHAFWGINDYTDNSSQHVFNITDIYDFNMSHAILIDPWNGTGYYNWTELYQHVWDNYVMPYTCYYTVHGKPLLLILEQCFEGWNNDPVTNNSHYNNADDSRFTIRIVGSHTVSDWYYGDVNNQIRESEPDYNLANRLNIDGHLNIFPRFDENYIGRENPCRLDYALSLGLYDAFWNLALDYADESTLHIITIASWNEFHERHAIEPMVDYTSGKDTYYLHRKTCEYIDLLKNPIIDEGEIWYNDPMKAVAVGCFGFICILIILLFFKRCS